jgi:hypothetical protein
MASREVGSGSGIHGLTCAITESRELIFHFKVARFRDFGSSLGSALFFVERFVWFEALDE